MTEKGAPRRKYQSHKVLLTKTSVMLPTELYRWLKEKARKEGKSVGLLLAEILTEFREREEAKSSN